MRAKSRSIFAAPAPASPKSSGSPTPRLRLGSTSLVMKKCSFAIVALLDENDDVAVGPSAWLIDKEICYWPRYTNQQRNDNDVEEEKIPTEKWRKRSVRILRMKDNALIF
nr:uncharacterized protein LOC124815463 [Hydra vulgaris]